jgi:hypothetical protein
MADTKNNRDLNTRDKEVRKQYVPASALPDPTPEPGYGFRYVMTHILGKADHTLLSRMRRDGWEPVKAADHPELMIPGNNEGNVEIQGLILCKNTVENIRAYEEYYARQAQDQMDSVDNSFMKDSDPRMRKFAEKTSTTTRGTGFGAGSK